MISTTDKFWLNQRPRLMTVRTPDAVPADMPCLIIAHGGLGSAAQAERQFNATQRLVDAGFAVAYLQGTKPALLTSEHYTFNSCGCCGYAQQHKVDDVLYTLSCIARLVELHKANSKRIYWAGYSNGADLGWFLSCRIKPDIIAGMAIIAGGVIEGCPLPTTTAIPQILTFNGTADHHVEITGGVGGDAIQPCDYKPLAETIQAAKRAGCQVESYILEGGGHTVPGSPNNPPVEMVGPTDPMDSVGLIMQRFSAGAVVPN
jgi:polyhydroxybutyrate depolymerase